MNPEEQEVFHRWLEILNRTGVPYLLGGAYAMYLHTGIWRDTKDMDIFLLPRDLKGVLDAFSAAGYETEIPFRHWLAKVFRGPYFVDLLFGFWNGRMKIAPDWFERSQPALFAGVEAPLISLEDLIASKVYVAAKDRFDGSDIVHLVRNSGGGVGWGRVLELLGNDSELLLWHLILYNYVYPDRSKDVKGQISALFNQVRTKWKKDPPGSSFRGPLLDPFSFTTDMEEMGYEDPRDMTPVVDEDGSLL